MAEKKVREMVLNADLQCECCYRRVRKVLCRFPEIRDWVFDEKANIVTITVVCCDPEKLRCTIYCKGRGSIKSIEIRQPEKPEPVAAPKEDAPNVEKDTSSATPPPSQGSEPDRNPPEPAPKQPEPASEPSKPAPRPAEPEPKPIETHCWKLGYGNFLPVGPYNFGHGGPSVYCEGYFYGRIGYDGVGPTGSNRCSHPHPPGCSVM